MGFSPGAAASCVTCRIWLRKFSWNHFCRCGTLWYVVCRPHPLFFFLWVWQSFRWPLTAYRGSRFSDASAVWTQNITERSVYHRVVCHAFLHGCHRLFQALLGSGLTAMITQDERCIIRTMLYNRKHKAENDWAAGCLFHVSKVINGKCPVSASTKSKKLLHYHARVCGDTHVAFFSSDCDVKQILISLKEPWRAARVPGAAVWPSDVLTLTRPECFSQEKKKQTKGKTPKPRALKCLLVKILLGPKAMINIIQVMLTLWVLQGLFQRVTV